MSGYIHVLKTLTSDPRFTRLARALLKHTQSSAPKEFGETLALGCLVKLWLRADSHIRDDDTLELGPNEIDEFLGIDGVTKILEPNWTQILDPDHVKLPNYLAHNGIEARRTAQAAARQAKHRSKGSNGQALHDVTEPVTHERDIVQRSVVTSPPLPSPSLPSPSEGDTGEDARASRSPTRVARKGARVPEPFDVTAEMQAWAAEKCPHVSVIVATEEFVDYWRGVAGRQGVKLDWPGTWRNRMRELEGRATRVPAGTKPAVAKGGWV